MTTTPAEGWAAPTDEVTLPSGRVAKLRRKLPVYQLLRTGALDRDGLAALEKVAQGTLDDPGKAVELIDKVCCMMFVEPRLTLDGAAGTVPVTVLEQDDQDFVLGMAFGGTPDTAAFPDGAGGDDGGAGREVLADDAKPAARAARGDAGGVQRRPRARRAASAKDGG